MENARLVDSEQLRISMVQDAFNCGMRFENITPDMQLAQWIVIGLKRLGEGRGLTSGNLDKIDRMGGTDHPDPTLGI